MISFKQRIFFIVGVLLLVVVTFFSGVYAGYESRSGFFAFQKEAIASSTPSYDFSPFWKAWQVIKDKYVDPDKVSDQEKVWGAIQGLAKSLDDPYTVFLPPEETKEFESEISGNFEGVGMEVGIRDDMLTVIAPIKGNPADRAGIKAGDKILKINGEITSGMIVDEAVRLIRGPKGTEVNLTLIREGKDDPIEVKVTRDVITIPTIDTEEIKVDISGTTRDGIYVIKLHNFSAVSTKLFREAINKFIDSKSDRLVLDLRGNPGGYLEAAVDIASWFLPKGKPVVREDFGGKRPENVYRSSGKNIFPSSLNLKMVVLVNEGSASASEILAGALQEYGVAKLVGAKTFGKGSVQELVKITPETSLKVTIARWLTPNGKSISEGGLTPDVEVKMTPEDVDKEVDPQLDKAVELLKK